MKSNLRTGTKKIAILGMDSNHVLKFTQILQGMDLPRSKRVSGMKVIRCLRFKSRFNPEKTQDEWQKILESRKVHVTRDFNEAVKGCDGILLVINDPSLHLDYFRKCAPLRKPIYVDSPLASNTKGAREMLALARRYRIPVLSASVLRFVKTMDKAIQKMPSPPLASVYGAMLPAARGSSIIWYGTYAFEMLQKIMGSGAKKVFTVRDPTGVVCIVEYKDGRRGLVELNHNREVFGGCLKNSNTSIPFVVEHLSKSDLVREIARFMKTGVSPMSLEASVEVVAMLDAAHRSDLSKKPELL